jgi:uncharacterized membrane protein
MLWNETIHSYMNQNSSVGPKATVNVSNKERIASAIAGYVLVRHSLKGKKFSLTSLLAGGYLLYRGATGHCPGYSALGKKKLQDPVQNINIRTSVVVNKPRNEVYAFWRRLENLPLFMNHLDTVVQKDSQVSEWKAKIPGGLGSVSWEARIVKEEPGSLLGWNSLPGAAIENAGKVSFEDTPDGGTRVNVVITYRAPLGIAGESIAKLFTPLFENMIREDIVGFKEYVESTEPAVFVNLLWTVVE